MAITPILIGTGNIIASTATLTITTTVDILAGDLLVIGIFNRQLGGSALSVLSVSDGTNSYLSFPGGIAINGAQTLEIWYKNNCSAVSAGATITITLTASGSSFICAVASRTPGVGSTSPVVGLSASNNSASATTLTCTTAAGAMSDMIAFGSAGYVSTPAYTESPAFTSIGTATTTATSVTLGYDTVSISGSIAFSPTIATAQTMCIVQATFFISPEIVSKEYALTEPVRSWTRMVGY